MLGLTCSLSQLTIPKDRPYKQTICGLYLNGCKIFTKLELTKGFYQAPMAPGDIPKTAVITLLGLFEWVRMPFGLRNTRCTFQCLMDQIIGDILHCFVYDILISSPDIQSHL